MRKSFDGLIAATKTLIGQDPLSGHLFMFVNSKGDYAKCLYWSRGGYCLWAKRLEAGRFAKVASITKTTATASAATSMNAPSTNAITMTDTQLMMWLDGIELASMKQRKRFVLQRSEPASRAPPTLREDAFGRDIEHRI